MSSEYNIDQLSKDVFKYAAKTKNDFLYSLEEGFTDRVADSIDADHILGRWRDPIAIVVGNLSGIDSALQDALDLMLTFDIPPLPDELEDDIVRDLGHVFESDQLDQMSDMFADVYNQSIGNSGYSYDGMPADKISAISTALYTKGFDTDAADLERDVDTVANHWSSDGYDVAPGALSFDVSELIAKFDRSRESRNTSPASMLANAIQSNIQTAYENGYSIEALHVDFTIKFNNAKYERVDALIKAYIGEVEKIQMEIRASTINISHILKAANVDTKRSIEEVKLNLDRELGHLQSWVSVSGKQISTRADVLNERIKLIEQTTTGYLSLFGTYASMFGAVAIQEQSVK